MRHDRPSAVLAGLLHHATSDPCCTAVGAEGTLSPFQTLQKLLPQSAQGEGTTLDRTVNNILNLYDLYLCTILMLMFIM